MNYEVIWVLIPIYLTHLQKTSDLNLLLIRRVQLNGSILSYFSWNMRILPNQNRFIHLEMYHVKLFSRNVLVLYWSVFIHQVHQSDFHWSWIFISLKLYNLFLGSFSLIASERDCLSLQLCGWLRITSCENHQIPVTRTSNGAMPLIFISMHSFHCWSFSICCSCHL